MKPPVTTRRPLRRLAWALGAALITLAGCGEPAQTLASGRISDAKPWDGTRAGDPHAVGGWKTGDAEAWRSQIRSRMLNQNEYARIAGTAP